MLPIIVMVPKGQPIGQKQIKYSIPPSNRAYTRKRQLPFLDGDEIELGSSDNEALELERELNRKPSPPPENKSTKSEKRSRSARSQSSKHSSRTQTGASYKDDIIRRNTSIPSMQKLVKSPTSISYKFSQNSVFSSDKTHTTDYEQQIRPDMPEVSSLRKRRANSVRREPLTFDPDSSPRLTDPKFTAVTSRATESESPRKSNRTRKPQQNPEKAADTAINNNSKLDIPKLSTFKTFDSKEPLNPGDYIPGTAEPLRRRSRAASVKSRSSTRDNDQLSEIPKPEITQDQPKEQPSRRRRAASNSSRKKSDEIEEELRTREIPAGESIKQSVNTEIKPTTPKTSETTQDSKLQKQSDANTLVSDIPPSQRRRHRSSSVKRQELVVEMPKMESSSQENPQKKKRRHGEEPKQELLKPKSITETTPESPSIKPKKSAPPIDVPPLESPKTHDPPRRRRQSHKAEHPQILPINGEIPKISKKKLENAIQKAEKEVERKEAPVLEVEKPQAAKKKKKLQLAAPEQQVSIPISPTPTPEPVSLGVSPPQALTVEKEKKEAPKLAIASTSPMRHPSDYEEEEEEEEKYVNPYDELCKSPRPRRLSADDLFFAILDDSD